MRKWRVFGLSAALLCTSIALATDATATQVDSAKSAGEAAAIRAELANQDADGVAVEANATAVRPSVKDVTLLGQALGDPRAVLVNPYAPAPAKQISPNVTSRDSRLGGVRGARACDHTIELEDSYGDGWNGNSVDVLVNGSIVLDDLTIASGAGPEVTTFQADTGDMIEVVFNETGTFAGECLYRVFDTNGRLLCADGLLDTVPTGCMTTGANCGADPCIGNEPVNDDCTGAVVVSTFPTTVTQDNACATLDCPGDFDYYATWYEIQLPYAVNTMSLDYCGGPEELFSISTLYLPGTCPVDCTAATFFDVGAFVSCPGDPNGPSFPQLTFEDIPGPGSIYLPVNATGLDGTPAAFSLTVDVVEVIADLYCETGATSTIDSAIEGVILGSISNTTVDECAGYSNFTDQSTDLQQNGTYELTIWSGDCDGGSTYGRWARAWIDYNQDGDFDDPGELVYDQGEETSGDYDVLEANITVPLSAALGQTRLRVTVDEAGAPDPCGTYTYGETEDYTVNITEAPPFGACCFPGGSCQLLDETFCVGSGGSYQGNGTSCDPNPCLGACCQLDGSCVLTTPDACDTGLFQGGATVCDPNPCVQPCPCPSTLTPPFCDDLEPADPNDPVYGGPWIQVTDDDGDWTYNTGDTPSSGTGPEGDHTTGSGYYFYTEASGNSDDLYILESPCIDLTTFPNPALSFYYHMLDTDGDDMGTLEIQVTDNQCITWDSVFSVTGDQGDQWNAALVDLSTYQGSTIKVRILGQIGPSFRSDIAIDDICVVDSANITGACCFEDGSCQVLTPVDCTNAAGAFAGPGSVCDPNPCPQPGRCCLPPTPGQVVIDDCQLLLESICLDMGGFYTGDLDCNTPCPDPTLGNDCSAPIQFTLPAMLDYRDDNYTCGRVDDYNTDNGTANCLSGLYDGGEDIIYEMTVTESICVDILLASNVGENYIGMAIGTACPPEEDCLYAFTSSSSVGFLAEGVVIPAGVYYVMIDSWPAPDCHNNFTLLMTASDACATGACCYGDPPVCEVIFEDECAIIGGAFAGVGSTCGGLDCNQNGVDDSCDILAGIEQDCNGNGIPDSCDIGTVSTDHDQNGVPDECDPDCNGNGIVDACDVNCQTGDCFFVFPAQCGQSLDCNANGIPDECEVNPIEIIQVSSRGIVDPDGRANQLSVLDSAGTLIAQYDQISGAFTDAWGYRDGTSDGSSTYFGWSGGVAKHDADGTNGELFISGGAPGGVTTWRALAYDPTGDSGAGSIWCASFGSDLIETDMAGNLLTTWPQNNGWSLYGLAYDHATGLLWGHDSDPNSGAFVRQIDPATGVATGPLFDSYFGITGDTTPFGIQGGLSMDNGTLFGLIQGTPEDGLASFDTAGNLTGPLNPNPRLLDPQTGETGNLGVAVISGALNDCNGNGIPDDCDIANGTSPDCNGNGVPDECDLAAGMPDCNGNGIPDGCELADGTAFDCNGNGTLDQCDIASGTSADCQGDGIPDECQLDDVARDTLLTEDFETGVPPTGWTAVVANAGFTWKAFTAAPIEGSTSADCEYDPALVPQDEWIVSDEITAVGDVTVSGQSNGSLYWGVTPFDNYDIEAWAIVGAGINDGDDILIGTLDDTWVTNFVTEPFSYTFASPGTFRLAFRYVGSDGAQAVLDDILVEGLAGAQANDCNQNGIPDECDISMNYGGFCDPAVGDCDTDLNGNGVPDSCEVCGDLDFDGDVDADDYWTLLDAYATCFPDLKYNPDADLDNDGCVGLTDFQLWLACYNLYNAQP